MCFLVLGAHTDELVLHHIFTSKLQIAVPIFIRFKPFKPFDNASVTIWDLKYPGKNI